MNKQLIIRADSSEQIYEHQRNQVFVEDERPIGQQMAGPGMRDDRILSNNARAPGLEMSSGVTQMVVPGLQQSH